MALRKPSNNWTTENAGVEENEAPDGRRDSRCPWPSANDFSVYLELTEKTVSEKYTSRIPLKTRICSICETVFAVVRLVAMSAHCWLRRGYV